jgi:hypothetical protein
MVSFLEPLAVGYLLIRRWVAPRDLFSHATYSYFEVLRPTISIIGFDIIPAFSPRQF